ncbi:hypothetical protein F0562_002849 [Nyssa sinensis]|uniref:Zinc-ribbon 15 domain-containing protein n=1 Tax=Nyssa sinensis TaxID=561372 RepID=A0A5J5BXQ4_9ASTE|nr:hypothetical protein F0562_002849 [Nyssa sinensis]
MFFFFVGGLEQQVRQVLQTGAGRCISCRSRADLVDYEKVLKLFFIPVWRWPGKEPLMHCNNCGLVFPPPFSLRPSSDDSSEPPTVPDILRCQFCSRESDAIEPSVSRGTGKETKQQYPGLANNLLDLHEAKENGKIGKEKGFKTVTIQ